MQKGMSALPPKADMCSALAHVRFVPIADIRKTRWKNRKTVARCFDVAAIKQNVTMSTS